MGTRGGPTQAEGWRLGGGVEAEKQPPMHEALVDGRTGRMAMVERKTLRRRRKRRMLVMLVKLGRANQETRGERRVRG